jgi:hypothetical protein
MMNNLSSEPFGLPKNEFFVSITLHSLPATVVRSFVAHGRTFFQNALQKTIYPLRYRTKQLAREEGS